MTTISFFVECEPPTVTAQQRRFRYKGANLKRAEAFWYSVMAINAPDTPLDGALTLEIAIIYPYTIKSRKEAIKHNLDRIPRITKIDCDNINKLPQDAMAKCGYFTNDCRIYNLNVSKWYGDVPGISVILSKPKEWEWLKA